MESTLILATIAANWRLVLTPGNDPTPRLATALAPKNLRLRLKLCHYPAHRTNPARKRLSDVTNDGS